MLAGVGAGAVEVRLGDVEGELANLVLLIEALADDDVGAEGRIGGFELAHEGGPFVGQARVHLGVGVDEGGQLIRLLVDVEHGAVPGDGFLIPGEHLADAAGEDAVGGGESDDAAGFGDVEGQDRSFSL